MPLCGVSNSFLLSLSSIIWKFYFLRCEEIFRIVRVKISFSEAIIQIFFRKLSAIGSRASTTHSFRHGTKNKFSRAEFSHHISRKPYIHEIIAFKTGEKKINSPFPSEIILLDSHCIANPMNYVSMRFLLSREWLKEELFKSRFLDLREPFANCVLDTYFQLQLFSQMIFHQEDSRFFFASTCSNCDNILGVSAFPRRHNFASSFYE